MKDLWRNLKNWQKMGIIGGLLVIIVVVIVAVINIASRPGINVEINFGDGVSIPSSEITKIREKLMGVIKANTSDFNDRTIYIADVRDYQEEISDQTSLAIFIADFDSIKESYLVEVTWPDPDDGSPNLTIACPLLSSKYPETPCTTEVNSSSDITSYLPYAGNLDDGQEYEVLANYDGGRMYLEVETNGDPNKALVETKDWIKSLNLDPDKYLYFVPAKQYIQASSSNTKDANVNKNLPYFVPGSYNVYPVTNESGEVTSIKAELAGCTDAQTDPEEVEINTYLKTRGINYPIEFEYCVN